MTKQRIDGPALHRSAEIIPFERKEDDQARRVRVSFSSEDATVLRASFFDEPWLERLGHDESEVDLSRLQAGGAVLWGHDSHSRESHVGKVERVWLENGRAYADLMLSARESVADLWQDIRDGIVTATSVGYRVMERVLTRQGEDGPDEYRVTRWQPFEISFVPVPADSSVGVGRSGDSPANFTITDLPEQSPEEVSEMTDKTEVQERAAPAAEVVAPEKQETATRHDDGIKAERARIVAVSDLARKHDMDAEFIQECITRGWDVKEAGLQILNRKADEQGSVPSGRHTARAELVRDERETTRELATEYLVGRAGLGDIKRDNPFQDQTLEGVARECLERAGVSTRGMGREAIFRSAITHSTGDFPNIFENALHKAVQAGAELANPTWSRFCATSTLSDFRPHLRYRAGSFNDLLPALENGEYKDGTIGDAEREVIQAVRKGRILNVSREMLINDDMSVFSGVARMLGQAASRTLDKDVFSLFATNGPTMGDGNPLFHATHGNIAGDAAAPTVVAFDKARSQMARQQDPDSNDFLDIRPSIWLGPIELLGTAQVVNDAQYDPDTANKLQKPNMVRGLVSDLVGTPRLSGTAWYLIASPNVEPVFEVGFLNGVRTPQLEMEESFRSDGMAWRIRYEYGVAAVGWRGIVRNAGA